MANGTQATGLKGFLENLSPAQLAAIGQAGNAILGASMPFMDPTQPGRAFSQGLAGVPQAYQQAQAAELKRRQGEISVRQAEAQERAISGLKDFFGRQAQAPTARTLPNAGPPGTTIPAAPGSTAQTIVPGERKTGPEEEMLGLLAQAYPEVFAQQYMSRLFAKPGERYSDPIEIDKHLYQRNLTTGQLERITPSAGVTVHTGEGIKPPTNHIWANPENPAASDPPYAVKPYPGGPADPATKEGGKKAALFSKRVADAAERVKGIEAEGYDPTTFGAAARNVGASVFGNWVQSDQGQRWQSAAREWMAPVLRYESGAAIPPEEFETYYNIYFPVPGDSDATIKQKAQARKTIEDAMQGSYGDVQATLERHAKQRGEATRPGAGVRRGPRATAPSVGGRAPKRLKYNPATGGFE